MAILELSGKYGAALRSPADQTEARRHAPRLQSRLLNAIAHLWERAVMWLFVAASCFVQQRQKQQDLWDWMCFHICGGRWGHLGIVMVDLRGQDECLCIHLIHTSLMCLENLNTLTSKVIKHMINAAFSGESMSLEKRVAVQSPVRGLPGSQTSDQRAAI